MASRLSMYARSYRLGEIDRRGFLEGVFTYGDGEQFVQAAEKLVEMATSAAPNDTWQNSQLVSLARRSTEAWGKFYSMYCLPKSGEQGSSLKAQCSTEQIEELAEDFREKINAFIGLYLQSIPNDDSISSDDE